MAETACLIAVICRLANPGDGRILPSGPIAAYTSWLPTTEDDSSLLASTSRSRPACFAAYNAVSARRISSNPPSPAVNGLLLETLAERQVGQGDCDLTAGPPEQREMRTVARRPRPLVALVERGHVVAELAGRLVDRVLIDLTRREHHMEKSERLSVGEERQADVLAGGARLLCVHCRLGCVIRGQPRLTGVHGAVQCVLTRLPFFRPLRSSALDVWGLHGRTVHQRSGRGRSTLHHHAEASHPTGHHHAKSRVCIEQLRGCGRSRAGVTRRRTPRDQRS